MCWIRAVMELARPDTMSRHSWESQGLRGCIRSPAGLGSWCRLLAKCDAGIQGAALAICSRTLAFLHWVGESVLDYNFVEFFATYQIWRNSAQGCLGGPCYCSRPHRSDFYWKVSLWLSRWGLGQPSRKEAGHQLLQEQLHSVCQDQCASCLPCQY